MVLLVEDNPDDAFMTQRAFELAHVPATIIVAHDGSQALHLLLPPDHEHQLHPAFVLLDLLLPGLNGQDVLVALRTDPSTRSLPVIILTASLNDHDRMISYENGANAFIHKPVDFQQFTATVRQLGETWLRDSQYA
jgi:DNA-binding response OmpR family regulator